ADLLARVQEYGKPGVAAIVYDFDQPVSWEILSRDLRVLALLNAGGTCLFNKGSPVCHAGTF
ncbi:MAG: hypothetical protein R6W31_16580, partial [Bacteroidales bacterium]